MWIQAEGLCVLGYALVLSSTTDQQHKLPVRPRVTIAQEALCVAEGPLTLRHHRSASLVCNVSRQTRIVNFCVFMPAFLITHPFIDTTMCYMNL